MEAKKRKAKGPGRPKGQKYTRLLQVMVEPELEARMEKYQHANKIRHFTEAHRTLLERGLK